MCDGLLIGPTHMGEQSIKCNSHAISLGEIYLKRNIFTASNPLS